MFGMTKRQFLKKSKKSLNETGTLLLLLRDIMNKKNQEKINNQEAYRQINNIRKSIESLFSEFEKNNPPSKCASLKQRILHILILLHGSIIAYLESLTAERKGIREESQAKLKESENQREEFRNDFLNIVREVDALLVKKHKHKKNI